jgi:DNA polymerase-3 subunit beta
MEIVVRKNEAPPRTCNSSKALSSERTPSRSFANVLLEAKGDEIRMLATDLEVALRSRCQASVGKSGSLTLPAKKLYEIVKALPETDVRIESDKSGCARGRPIDSTRTCRRCHARIFRRCPTAPAARRLRCRARLSARWLPRRTLRSPAKDTRYFLNGAKFVLKPGSLTLVADRRASSGARRSEARLGRDPGDGRHPAQEDPARARQAIWAMVTVTIQFEAGENHLFFEVGGRVLISRMIDWAVPGLRSRHSQGQRQDDRVRSASADQRGEARRAALQRAVASREDRSAQGQSGRDVDSSEFGEASEQLTVEYDGPT